MIVPVILGILTAIIVGVGIAFIVVWADEMGDKHGRGWFKLWLRGKL